jgi:putative acetyltransferase
MIVMLVVREEAIGDEAAIEAVTIDAFRDHPVSRQTEQLIVRALRAAGALSLSLVAIRDGRIIGHVAFSPVSISDGSADWLGVGPLSVDPAYQRQGVGTRLMHEALARLRAKPVAGCVLVGDPDFYERFGFRHETTLQLPGVPQEVFLVLPLSGDVPQGTVSFHPAFQATA